MALPISPIRTMTKLDRIRSEHLYRAVDTQGDRPRYLHLSGHDLTGNIFYSWYGTAKQFKKLCQEFEWDALTLVPADRLRF